MDEFTWVWMYQSWLQDLQEMHKTYKDYALFVGAFSNPEMAKNISRQDNKFESSDEEFEETFEAIKEVGNLVDKPKPRRRRINKG